MISGARKSHLRNFSNLMGKMARKVKDAHNACVQTFAHTHNLLNSFVRDERGSLLPAVAGSMIVLVGGAGLAVDGARMFYVRDVLQKSLDSAGLAAGHALEVENMTADAQEFFDSNFAAASGVASSSQMNIEILNDNSLVRLTASATIDTTFMRLFGFEEVSVVASTEVTRETRGMELMLVMDNTGSMRTGGRLAAAQAAARNLVDLVYGDNETNTNLWVGVTPFVAVVNPGNTHASWLSAAGQDRVINDYAPGTWKGCMLARDNGGDETDAPPSIRPFEPYLWEDTDPTVINFGGFIFVLDPSLNNWLGFLGEINETPAPTGTGPNKACGTAITPLVAERTTVRNAIDEMEAWDGAGTTVNLGLAWGWRALSPRWRGLWGGNTPNELPLDYDTPFMDKVIVLLTDGDNVISETRQTAYGTASEFGFPSGNAARVEIDARTTRTCNAVKDAGVIIYSITFGDTVSASTENLIRNCASNPGFYFHAPSGDDLSQAFATIGRQLSNLRLSQ